MRRIGRIDVFVQRFWNGRQRTLSERLGEVIRACRQAWQSFLNYPLQPPSLLRHKGPADWPGASAINLRTSNAATGLEPARLCRSLLLNRLVRPDRFASAPPRAHPSRLIDTFDAGWGSFASFSFASALRPVICRNSP